MPWRIGLHAVVHVAAWLGEGMVVWLYGGGSLKGYCVTGALFFVLKKENYLSTQRFSACELTFFCEKVGRVSIFSLSLRHKRH